ncbi:Acg family FMN-binding oxidoreductase [Streptomyces sp. NPDC094438]|uniref:Acg family FMN-binding oxidoreductase n=1 Tax=Streptomyces sp. NPDC094438 TaxID=3366061 RepID=UPI0037FABA0E
MFPRHLDTTSVISLVEDAVTAPSMHNAQPWKFLYRPGQHTIELHGDPERAMPRSDPDGRSLRMGCAAALFNLRVSAANAGWEPVTRLLPSPDDSWYLAEVELREPARPDDDLPALHPALRRRHTSRFPYTDEEIPAAVLDGLRAAALLEGAKLLLPDAWHTEVVLGLVHDSERYEAGDAAAREETARWTYRDVGNDGPRADGVPAYAFGPRQSGSSTPVRDFGGWRPDPGRETARFERHPRIAILGTAQDTPLDWLHAGQALQRVLLRATLDGLVASMTSQPLEWPELRWAVRDPSSVMGHVHMIIRLGYGPQGPATPRRPVREVLDIV